MTQPDSGSATNSHSAAPAAPPEEGSLREHVYDGIAEYNRRLPNWWLVTFYATIVFAIIYWAMDQQFPWTSDTVDLQARLDAIEAARIASGGELDDDKLIAMSRNPVIVDAGRATFETTCVSCHGAALTGGVGPSLVDSTWIHGSRPTNLLDTVTNGVLVKGMPAWGPVLGPKKTSEVVAYVLSQQPSETASR